MENNYGVCNFNRNSLFLIILFKIKQYSADDMYCNISVALKILFTTSVIQNTL
jgi:low affinity Fe/Cu permease